LESDPQHGTLVLNADGSFTYTPAANFFGSDIFTYKAIHGTKESDIATVTITVNEVNDAPVASNDSYSTDEDTPLNIAAPGVLGNDNDADGDALTVVLVSGVTNGQLTLNANGLFSYTPNANFNGTDSFTYLANDGTANSADVATVTITVKAVNDAPVANDDVATTTENTPVLINVLANDSDVENDGLTALLVSGVSHGTLTLNSDGSFTYVPHANFFGTDSFTYKAKDGTDESNVATVDIEVVAASHDVPRVSLITDPCDPNDPTKTALQVIGTDGDDKIRFVPQGHRGEIKVLINGVSQGIYKPTVRIIAFGLGGNDDIEIAGSIALAAHLQGDAGNDRLKGGAGPSVLCGGDGDDLLIGGSGRSILIGDRGADRLVGNGEDDILIGGYTSYGCDHEVWCEILEIWTRSDLSYTQRTSRVSTGQFALNRTTIFDDGDYDQLTGAAGTDWFFAGVKDKITDRKNFELVGPS
jgi:VCBS repeat-containing protein